MAGASCPVGSNSEGIFRISIRLSSAGKMSSRAQNSLTPRDPINSLAIAAARSAWPRPW